MQTVELILACVLFGGLFLVFTGMNYRLLILTLKKAERIPSPAAFIGGISGAILVICLTGLKYPLLILLPLVLDPGSIPLLIRFIVWLIKGKSEQKKHSEK